MKALRLNGRFLVSLTVYLSRHGQELLYIWQNQRKQMLIRSMWATTG